MAKFDQFPVAMPDGTLLPHMSARLRTATIDALFVASGGFERALAWVEASDANYETFFTKVWARGAARSTNVEVGVTDSYVALLEKLDAGEHAQVVNGTSRVVEDA